MRHTILVVDDDHALRDVLLRGLRDEGFTAVGARDGAGALRLAGDAVDAVVLDVGLPDADGRDVCQAMRANGFRAPVLFLTAHHRLTDRLGGFSAGGDDYLTKPFHLVELAARLRAAIKRAGREAPARTGVLPVLDRLTAAVPADGPATVTVSCPHTLTVGVPAALLERIVSPLLDNALRHARFRVLIRAGQHPDGSVCVEITDDGPGVPGSFTDRLFQPGHRADPDDGHGGAGLGLPLARRLARSAGGDVRHDARHAPGAAFVISLPAA